MQVALHVERVVVEGGDVDLLLLRGDVLALGWTGDLTFATVARAVIESLINFELV